MNTQECEELFETIIPEWTRANNELFQQDLVNLAIFGNTARHLHAHLIPRYNTERIFEDMLFRDPNPSGNYAPYEKKEIPLSTQEKIITDFKNIIGR